MAVDRMVVSVNSGDPRGEVAIEYEAAQGTVYGQSGRQYVVYLPSMIAPENRFVVCDKVGQAARDVVFVNDPTDVLVFKNGQRADPGEAARLAQARAVVATYLRDEAGKMELDLAGLAAQVEKQSVEAFTGGLTDWAGLLAKADAAARGGSGSALTPKALADARKTEAITFPGKRGTRQVFANMVEGKRGYTVGTLVHELFHTLESDQLERLSGNDVEAVTEYFARQALGLDDRVGQGGDPCYLMLSRALATAMATRGVTHEMLVKAYFLGDATAIEYIDANV